ncbi:uncharacterized protein LOC112554512 [Pomacea canaliculata]|uniref:uncharacterized protein LOC112554512 n=1 Tax=Pomacea canaliculata TaxID=400727 RepID=UPI000D7346E8|nr:uncharacterized protein LOC112554512 [Pomacea canaliculata]XP_025078085.1 uncharacterized protein LOC112554512 [Pomacea canaliculata]
MDRGTLNKPVAMVTWMLLSSGKLQLVILFTFIALIELLLSVSIFVCPCETELKRLYGLSFLIVPAVMLFLADFPWKLVQPRPPARILLYMSRRPLGLGLTWFIVGLIERKFVSCMVNDFNEECEQDNRVTWLQLAGLYLWLAVVITIIILLLWRRRNGNYGDGGSMAELITKFEINESMEKEALQKRIRYGSTRVPCEDDVSLAVMQVVQPGSAAARTRRWRGSSCCAGPSCHSCVTTTS